MKVGDLVRINLPDYSSLHGQLCIITKLYDCVGDRHRVLGHSAAYLFFMDGRDDPIYVSDLEVVNESR